MTSTDFTLGSVAQTLGAKLDEEKASIGELMETMDGDDPAATFKMEMEVSTYKNEMGLMAALTKDISDVMQQIIQKI